MSGCNSGCGPQGSELPAFSFCHPPECGRPKPQNLNFTDGFREVRDPEVRKQHRRELGEKMRDYFYEGGVCGPCNVEMGTPLPKWLKYDRQVLRFYCYFKEPVNERRDENFRVRKCTIYFYLEDGSIHVSEPRQDNSGLMQGQFLKRHRIPKKDGSGYLSVKDFVLGTDLTIYDRTFRICNCDTFTRRYLMKHRFEVGNEEDVPGEPLSAYRKSLERHRVKVHKEYANKQFLENDGKVLRFFCVWDDRGAVYGERRPYVLHYFLADDTIEILEMHERNNGRYPFPMMLRRMKLPREIPTDLLGKNIGAQHVHKSSCYNECDLHIGSFLTIYGRDLLLHDCDDFTRQYYKEKWGVTDDMLEPVAVQEKAPVLARMEVPPYNGYGSDADSMQNCISLIPKAAMKDFNKFLNNDGKIMCFSARFAEDANHRVIGPDRGRLFVFQYYLSDDTIAIYEPPARNSGIVGGKFLYRQDSPPKPGTKRPYGPSDMLVGAKLEIHRHLFELLQADEWTLKYMERNLSTFPQSDYRRAYCKLNSSIERMPEDGLHNLKLTLPKGNPSEQFSPIDILLPILARGGIDMTKQELVTIERGLENGQEPGVQDIYTLIVKFVCNSMSR
ncbi:EF-hand domain-containing protein 1 [Selaginella moellendorffii]|uniref:EF-hand domain-containing protein 1 n=1 Tax=Selaginella moellendorffii TaxID=88036 RepID=UPI000D1CF57E|nr:EF-hand domain-containing protein 1 [Selaginella moellendorffii]|eukprot:XP_024522463.1 EF-hand domain-containing protein 1 [Selaginella moellendorffii]